MPLPDLRRVAIWAAVSSKAQLDGDSLPGQIRAGQEWAASIDAQVVATYQVPGHSRDYIFFHRAAEEMPAYRQLQQACEARAFDVLWCRARDRLGRTDALIAQVEALVGQAGAVIYSALMPQPLETSDVAQIYMSAMERASSQAENVIRVRRSQAGQHARARSGLFPGRVPYGYVPVYDGSRAAVAYELDPQAAEVLRITTELFLDGLGYQQIAMVLERKGYLTPDGCREWNSGKTRRIMHNDAYAGTVVWSGEIQCRRSDKFPHVWDDATHRAVIRERKRRAELAFGSTRATAISGVAYCARCGQAMNYQVVRNDRTYEYYQCTRHKQRGDCHPNNTYLPKIVRSIEHTIVVLGTGDLDGLIDRVMPDATALEKERALAQQQIADAQMRRRRLGRLVVEGQMQADVYSELDHELREEIAAVGGRLAQVEEQLAALPQPEEMRQQLLEILSWRTDEDGWLLDRPKEVARAALQNAQIRAWCADCEVATVTIGAVDGLD